LDIIAYGIIVLWRHHYYLPTSQVLPVAMQFPGPRQHANEPDEPEDDDDFFAVKSRGWGPDAWPRGVLSATDFENFHRMCFGLTHCTQHTRDLAQWLTQLDPSGIRTDCYLSLTRKINLVNDLLHLGLAFNVQGEQILWEKKTGEPCTKMLTRSTGSKGGRERHSIPCTFSAS